MIRHFMNLNLIRPQTAIIMVAAASTLSLCACKGRHANDMVPAGDTVEVVIDPSAGTDECQDSTNINDSTKNEI